MLEGARAIAETLGDVPLKVAANLYLGTASLMLGDYRRAEDFLRSTVQSLEGNLSQERCGLAGFPAAMARSYWAMALAERGEFDEGIAQGQEGVRIAEALDHPYSLVVASRGLGFLYGVQGEFSQAIRLLERALTLSRDRNLTIFSPSVTGFLGSIYARSGRVAEGLSLLVQALKAGEDWDSATRVTQLGEANLLAARLEDAIAFAGRALTLTRERGERGYEAHALRLLGEIPAHRDPPDVGAAEENYRQAMALAEELGMRPLLAHCHLGLGRLYRQAGKREEAQEHLTTARTMFRDMAMRFWLDKAEMEIKELG